MNSEKDNVLDSLSFIQGYIEGRFGGEFPCICEDLIGRIQDVKNRISREVQDKILE